MGGDKHKDLQVLSNLRMMLMYFNVISWFAKTMYSYGNDTKMIDYNDYGVLLWRLWSVVYILKNWLHICKVHPLGKSTLDPYVIVIKINIFN